MSQLQVNTKIRIPKWDELFMRHVYLIGSKSKDLSTQIGAVLVKDGRVISEGYNGICRSVRDDNPERQERPEKYHWFEHGERNAFYNCARTGISSIGSILYTNDVPCTDCARGAIQVGCSEIVLHKQWAEIWASEKGKKWVNHDDRSMVMFEEAGVRIRYFDMFLGIQTLISGKIHIV